MKFWTVYKHEFTNVDLLKIYLINRTDNTGFKWLTTREINIILNSIEEGI